MGSLGPVVFRTMPMEVPETPPAGTCFCIGFLMIFLQSKDFSHAAVDSTAEKQFSHKCQEIHKNPLYRVLRCDKLTYAILEETLRTYVTPISIHKDNLTVALFKREPSKLKKIAEKLLKHLSPSVNNKYAIEIKRTEVDAGSGSLPLEEISSIALVFNKVLSMF